MSEKKLFDLSVEEALAQADVNVQTMQAETGRDTLKSMGILNVDTAFELGYETALHDLRRYMAPDPFEVGVLIVEVPSAE